MKKNVIDELCRQSGLSVKDFAFYLGVSTAVIYAIKEFTREKLPEKFLVALQAKGYNATEIDKKWRKQKTEYINSILGGSA